MNDEITPWTVDVGVTELTDTDLVSARNHNMNVSDPSRTIHRCADAIAQRRGFETRSSACDYALRIELAAIIDDRQIPFVRQDFGIAYLIPPEGTYEQYLPDEPLAVSENGYDDQKRHVNLSTAPTVYEMVNSAVAEGVYDSFSHAVKAAVQRVSRVDG